MITPQEVYSKLNETLEIKSLFLKREDLHPYGSHKGRSIPTMIDTYREQGIRHFAISSSGNAALAAAMYVQKLNTNNTNKISLDILVGQHINTQKLRKLEHLKNENIKVTMHDRPLQTLFNITKDPEVRGLRQSTDDTALIGYSTLADELMEISDLQAIFIGTSSGTTAQALIENFKKNKRGVEVNIVQTSSCHPMADDFIDDYNFDEQSIADAVVDHGSIRKDIIVKLVRESGGSGYIASNEQIRDAVKITAINTGLNISTNSALSVAGLMQAVYTGKTYTGSVVCIICGN